MGHVASGPTVALAKAPSLVATQADLSGHIVADSKAGPLHFRIIDVAEPNTAEGLALEPFYSIRHERYQLYFQLKSGASTRPDAGTAPSSK
jgi:hypothetical protein